MSARAYFKTKPLAIVSAPSVKRVSLLIMGHLSQEQYEAIRDAGAILLIETNVGTVPAPLEYEERP